MAPGWTDSTPSGRNVQSGMHPGGPIWVALLHHRASEKGYGAAHIQSPAKWIARIHLLVIVRERRHQ
jgi:hypothetical protein